MWVLGLAGKLFVLISAFGMTSQGRRREEAIRFGLKGTVAVLVIAVLISIFNRSWYIFTLSQDMAVTFVLAFIVLKVLFSLLLRR